MAVYLRPGLFYGGARAWASVYEDSMAREAWAWRAITPPPKPPKPLLEQIHEDRLERWEDELEERFPEPPKDDGWDDWA